MIIGEIETVGGILTADPITQAEGEYNVETGILHQESNKVLTAIEQNDDHFEQSAEAKDSGQN